MLLGVERFIQAVGNVVALALPVLVAIALAVFFWGIIKYLRNAGDPKAAQEGKSIMIYGIIALFVMVSIWGIIYFIGDALWIDQGGGIIVPKVPQ
jgi:type III secretory pathway component EscT